MQHICSNSYSIYFGRLKFQFRDHFIPWLAGLPSFTNGWLYELARWTKSCFLIGYLNGLDGSDLAR